MSSSLLQTKFHIPVLRPTRVARPRLLDKLNAGLTGKLTLVAAAAGFGKSTLIGDWLRQTAITSSWLSLDAADNDLNRFLRYLIAALQTAQPALGNEAVTLLQLLQPPAVEEIFTTLFNDLVMIDQKLILVLDDYHTIEAPVIHQAMSFLLERLPPQLHLVLTSRANPPLPLARLRGRGELSELRASDLRFTAAETTAFFQGFANIALTTSDLALLTERTEGWIVGLQLAALSLDQQSDAASFVRNFTGSNAFILDYLVEEVLSQRSAADQKFLLYTSILARMCGALCDALLAEHLEQPAHAILQELERANLFIISLDNERHWYRYHHLFAGVLQQRLRQAEPAHIAELHRRASLWFEAEGLIDEAIAHARQAGDKARVVQLVEQEIRTLIMHGVFDTANRWLASLPEPLIQERPRLLLAQAWLRLFEIPIGNIEASLRQAENILGQNEDQQAAATLALLAEIAALRAAEAGISGKPAALQLAEEALRLAGADNLFVQSIISYALASFDWDNQQWGTIRQRFEQAIQAAQSTGNVIIAASLRYNFAMFYWQRGDLAGAAALLAASEIFTKSQPNRWPWSIVDSVWVGRGRLCYEQNELEQAQQFLCQGIELAQRRNNLYVIIDGFLTQAWVYQAQGEDTLSQGALEQAIALVGKATRPGTAQLVGAHQARLWLAQGKIEQAIAWAQTSAQSIELAKEHPVQNLALAAVYIAQGAKTAKQALAILERLAATATEWASRRLQIYALQTLAWRQLGQPSEAQSCLKQAMAIGEAAGYLRLLADQGPSLKPLLIQLPTTSYRDKVLAALREDRITLHIDSATAQNSSVQQGLIEPLSERELEVLRLVVSGASNQVIANQLVITLGTVKNHMTNILGKLGVRNRWEATRKTEELRLLM